MALTKQKGLWSTRTSIVFKDDLPVQPPAAGDVLIKNVALASNPADWKAPALFDNWEGVSGNDVAGTIEAIGDGVTGFDKGDRVAAMTTPRFGGYQQYSTAYASTTFKLGPRTAFEDAATVPAACATAFLALYKCLEITPYYQAKENTKTLIINGASSSVGSYAVQFAKLSGLFVVGIAGAGGTYTRELGADAVVDYRGKSAEQIADAVKGALGGKPADYMLDAIGGAIPIARGIFGPEGGRYTTVMPSDTDKIADNVHNEPVLVGRANRLYPDFSSDMFRRVSAMLEDGTFKPNQKRIIPGGLLGVKKGLKELEEGKVSAEKLVYVVADTPGL